MTWPAHAATPVYDMHVQGDAPGAIRDDDPFGELAEEQRRPCHARPIVTAIEPAGTFWLAEEYHQHYLARHSRHFCH